MCQGGCPSGRIRGNQQDSLQKTHKMMQSMKFDKLNPGVPMYKCRENCKLFHYTKDEMSHILYDKRNLVGNQRFSLSGKRGDRKRGDRFLFHK